MALIWEAGILAKLLWDGKETVYVPFPAGDTDDNTGGEPDSEDGLPAVFQRLTANVSNILAFFRDLRCPAFRAVLDRPAQGNLRLAQRILHALLLKSADLLCIVKTDRHPILLGFVLVDKRQRTDRSFSNPSLRKFLFEFGFVRNRRRTKKSAKTP